LIFLDLFKYNSWVVQNKPTFLKASENRASFKGHFLYALDCFKELKLIKFATFFLSRLIHNLSMPMLVRLKQYNVKRLKDMRCMWRKSKDMDIVEFTKVKKLLCEMAFISIINQDTMSSNTRLTTLGLKMSNILYRELIICVSSL
jgi:hypothetical protein